MGNRKGRPRTKRRILSADDRLILAAQARLLADMAYVEACEDRLIQHGEITEDNRDMLRRLANETQHDSQR